MATVPNQDDQAAQTTPPAPAPAQYPDTNPPRDWAGIVSIGFSALGALVGMIPVLGKPIRMTCGLVAIALAIAGLVEAKKSGADRRSSVIGAVAGLVVVIWGLVGMSVVAGLVSFLLAQI